MSHEKVVVTHVHCINLAQDHQINEPKWDAWKVLPEAVRTGQVAFALAHDGLDMHEVSSGLPKLHPKTPSFHLFIVLAHVQYWLKQPAFPST